MMGREIIVFLGICIVFLFIYGHYNSNNVGEVVNIYSSRKSALIQPVIDKFVHDTGIKVNMIVDSDAHKLVTRILNEGKNTKADVVIMADASNLIYAQQNGILQQVSSDVLEDIINPNIRNKFWFGVTERARVIIYNKNKIDKNLIQNYEDLARPELKGKLLMRSSNSAYNQSLLASIIASDGVDAAQNWVHGIVYNFARKPQGGDIEQIKAVAHGIGDVAVVNTYYFARLKFSDNKKDCELVKDVDIIFPNQDNRGTHVNISAVAMTKYSKNKDNAIKLMEFMVSDVAQRIFVDNNHEYPVNRTLDDVKVKNEWGKFKPDEMPLSDIAKHIKDALQIADQEGWR